MTAWSVSHATSFEWEAMAEVSLSHWNPAFGVKSMILDSSKLSVVLVLTLSPFQSSKVGHPRIIEPGLNELNSVIRSNSLWSESKTFLNGD